MLTKREDFPPNPFEEANFVPPEGSPTARIVVIGEAPGAQEDKELRPFVGGAGTILRYLLNSVGIDRRDVYITNVLKYRPPKNDITCPEAQNALPAFRQALLKELSHLRPTVIVPMGNTALEALGFNYKITNARGAIFSSDIAKVIPTFHPAYIMRQQQEYYTAHQDWQKIARHATGGAVVAYREEFNTKPTIQDLELFAVNIKERTKNGTRVRLALDLETYFIEESPLFTPIKLVGMAMSESNALVIPFITQSGEMYWDTDEKAIRAIQAIASILENPFVTIMVHNALFDILVLMNHGFTVNAMIYDTMIAHYLIYHPARHALEYLVSIYTDYQPWKLEHGNSDAEFRTYNARDCVVLHMIYKRLDQSITDNGVRFVFNNLMNTIVPTCQMMLNGIHIDQDRYNEVRKNLEDSLFSIAEKIRRDTGVLDLNIDSPKQLGDLLFKKMKLKSGMKTDKGAQSTNEATLNRLSLRYPENETINDILEYRNKSTQYKMFIKNLVIHEDGRVHTEFKLTGVVTGRYASRNPNMQNLPARKDESGSIRGMYTAPPGRTIVQLDYSQVELMIFAVMANDEIWLDAFASGKDVHALNAEALIGYYDPKYRTFTKNFIYGFIYGSEGGEVERMAPKELIQQLSITTMMQNLSKTHPWLFSYRDEIASSIDTNHYVKNAFGRKRYFIGTPTKADYRSGFNFPIQSTAADIMHIKTPEIIRALKPSDKLILQLHDAYYIETDINSKDRVATVVKSIMEEPVHTPTGRTFNLKADVEIGASLSKKDMESWNGNVE